MKGRVAITDEYITMKPARVVFWILAIIGALMLLGGIYLLGELHPVDHILFSFGIIFTAGSMYFFMNTRYNKVYINRDENSISILDSSIRSIHPVKIPLSYFHWVALQRKSDDSGGGFEIHLMNSYGSSLLVAEYPDNKQAIDFARQLQSRLGIDILMEEEAINRLLQKRKSGRDLKDLVTRDETSLIVSDQGSRREITWKNRWGLLQSFFFGAILYGFFHISWFVIAPSSHIGFFRYVLFGFAGFIALILLYSFLVNLLGRPSLTVGSSGITWHISLLGKWIGRKEMDRGNVAVVRNSLNLDDNTITIISRQGLEAMSRLARTLKDMGEGKRPGFAIVSDVMTLKDEMIIIDASALTIADRLFIEQAILRIM